MLEKCIEVFQIKGKRIWLSNLNSTAFLFLPLTSRFYGVFQLRMPAVMIKDPELIRQIGVKDFDNFPNHRPFITDDVDPMFGNVMLNLQGM